MKKLIILCLIFSGCALQSCQNAESSPYVLRPYTKVIVVSECEYVVASISANFSGDVSITHKGNCKYCLIRNK